MTHEEYPHLDTVTLYQHVRTTKPIQAPHVILVSSGSLYGHVSKACRIGNSYSWNRADPERPKDLHCLLFKTSWGSNKKINICALCSCCQRNFPNNSKAFTKVTCFAVTNTPLLLICIIHHDSLYQKRYSIYRSPKYLIYYVPWYTFLFWKVLFKLRLMYSL